MAKNQLEQVPKLLEREMRSSGLYEDAQIKAALRLWDDYVRAANPAPRKPAIYSASVEYTIGRLDFVDGINQQDVAKRHGTSTASLSQTYRAITGALDIMHFDPRYCSVEDNPMADMIGAMMGMPSTSAPLSWDPMSRARLLAARQPRGQWSVLSLQVGVQTLPGGARIYLVHDDDAQLMRANTAVPVLAPQGPDVAQALAQAIMDPAAGAPGRPERVRVDHAPVVAEIQQMFADVGVEVVADPCDDLAHVRDSATEHMNMGMSMGARSYLDADGVEPELVGSMFRGGEDFLALGPWTWFEHEDVFEVRTKGAGGDGLLYAMIMGHNSEIYGVAGFETLEDLEAFSSFSRRAMRGDPRAEVVPTSMSLSFDHVTDLHPDQLREIDEHGWRDPDSSFVPVLLKVGGEHGELPVTLHDTERMTAALWAICALTGALDEDSFTSETLAASRCSSSSCSTTASPSSRRCPTSSGPQTSSTCSSRTSPSACRPPPWTRGCRWTSCTRSSASCARTSASETRRSRRCSAARTRGERSQSASSARWRQCGEGVGGEPRRREGECPRGEDGHRVHPQRVVRHTFICKLGSGEVVRVMGEAHSKSTSTGVSELASLPWPSRP